MAQQASPQVFHTKVNRDFFVPMETIDMSIVNNYIGILYLHKTSIVSPTATYIGDNAYAWVHPSLYPPSTEATEEVQTTHADGHFRFQERWCSLILMEDCALLGSIILLHEPQWFQELAGSRSFSYFSDERKSPHSRSLCWRWYDFNRYYSSDKNHVLMYALGNDAVFIISMPV